jgi:hypothetical protein
MIMEANHTELIQGSTAGQASSGTQTRGTRGRRG